ncbi:MAG: hypothetical protein HOO96_40625 [Polyangiaceae bacterium]|nr:hypothetical protein [Polyangiaceae bacterium]
MVFVGLVACSGDDDPPHGTPGDGGPPDVIVLPLDACPDGGCDPTPPPLVDVPLETHASVFGRVVDANGAALGGYTIEATDIPGSQRSDVVLTTAADGSFRLRLTSIPETAVEGTPPAHVLLAFKLAGRLTAVRDVYLHPGEVLDVGSVALIERDPKVTVIGPAGGVATDTSGEIEVTIPPGALSANISVQVTPFRKRAHFTVPLPDVTTTMYGFDLSPDGTSFAQPVTVRIANTKSIPTSIEIPVGTADLKTGRWEHEGFASWDGTRWSTKVQHFSPHDVNGTEAGVWVARVGNGRDPNRSQMQCGVGSSAGTANGVLKASIPLPAFARRGASFEPGLSYSSDLAGTFRPQPADVTPPSTPAASYPATGMQRLVRSPKLDLSCVPRSAADEIFSTAPGSCAIGACRAGATTLGPIGFSVGAVGGGTSSSQDQPAGVGDTYVDGVFYVPGAGADTFSAGYQTQRLTIGFSQSKSCISRRGQFGTMESAGGAPVEAQVEPGPITIERPAFLPHRMGSPFGPGWMLSGWSHLYRDPTGSESVLMDGDGTPEYFRPRLFTRPIFSALNGPIVTFAMDRTTGDLLAFDRFAGKVVSLRDDGTTTDVFPATVAGFPLAMATTYVGGARHVLLATESAYYDVSAAGTRNLGTRVLGDSGTPSALNAPAITGHGDQAIFTSGDPLAPQILTANLADAVPVASPLLATTGEPASDPKVPLGSLRMGHPHGVAFAADGTLYVGDRRRNLVFRVLPNAAGRIGTDSRVERAFGDGVGRVLPPKGMRLSRERFPLNQPTRMAVAGDGMLWVSSAVGMVVFDPRSGEAALTIADASSGDDGDLSQPLLMAGGYFEPRTRGELYYLPPSSSTIHAASVRLASEYAPTRSLQFTPSGDGLLTDTTTGTVSTFDARGRLTEERTREGDPLRTLEYVSATSSSVSRIVTANGDATTFAYTGGRVTSIVDAANRRTELSYDGLGNMARLKLPDGSAHKFAYEHFKLVRRESPRGDVTQYRYGDDGVLRGTTKPAGDVFSMRPALTEPIARDANGRTVRTGQYTDARGVTHIFSSNDRGQLATEQYTADGKSYTSTTVYAASLADLIPQGAANLDYGNPLAYANNIGRGDHVEVNGTPVGRRYAWDSQGRVLHVFTNASDANPPVLERTLYGADDRPFETWTGANNALRYVYDANGRLTKVTKHYLPGGASLVRTEATFTYRADGLVDTASTNGLTTTFGYDPLGLVNRVEDSLGRVSTAVHDAAGNVTSASDGRTSASFSFDANGRMTAAEDAPKNRTTFGYTSTSCGCSEEDRITEIRTPDLPAGKAWTFDYGPEGRLITRKDPDGRAELFAYKPTGELTQTTDRLGRIERASFDQLGRAIGFVDAAGRAHGSTYPIPGAGAWQGTAFMGGAPGATGPSLDAEAGLGNGEYQIGVGSFSGQEHRSLALPRATFYRDATFQLVHVQDYTYRGQVSRLRDVQGVPATVGGGLTDSPLRDHPQGQFFDLTHGYDVEFGTHPTAIEASRPAGYSVAQLTYDADWNTTRSEWFNGGGLTDYTREAGGRLTDTRVYGGFPNVFFADANANSHYAYDKQGYLSEVTNGDGPHGISYDTRGQVASVVAAEGTYTHEHDAMGRSKRLVFPDGHERIQLFDVQGRITSRCYIYPGKTGLDRCYTATYDFAGNVTRMVDPEGTDVVAIDALDRLTTITRQVTGQADVVATYTYNALGALKQNGEVALADQRPKLAGGGLADSAVPASVGGRTVARDLGGNVTALGDATFTWDRFGHLQSATQARGADTDTYGFGYDASFRRFEQTKTNAGGTTWEYYAYEGANIVAQLAPGPLHVTRSWLYDGVDHPLRMHDTGAANPIVYYEVDLAGNVRRLRAPGGADLGGYRYAAFGKAFAADAKTPAAVVEQPLRWKGRWWSDFGGPDGTYDMRARVWAPEIGIFLSADDFGFHDARGTLWSWPNQNPVNLSDPSGNCPQCLILGVVGGIGAGLGYALTAPTSLTWGQFMDGAAYHMAAGATLGALSGLGPGAAMLVFGATMVENENQIGMFAFPIFFGAAFQESCPTRSGAARAPDPMAEGHNAANAAKLRQSLAAADKAGEVIESLQQTGDLPSNYVTKGEARAQGWREGKAVNNSVPGGQIGGDVYRNTNNVVPEAPGRVWHEADVGLSNTMSRAKQPGTRLLYSNDGLLYVSADHYGSAHPIGRWK